MSHEAAPPPDAAAPPPGADSPPDTDASPTDTDASPTDTDASPNDTDASPPDAADARLTLPALAVWGAAALAAPLSPHTSLTWAVVAGCAAALVGLAAAAATPSPHPLSSRSNIGLLVACLVCVAAGFAVVGVRQRSVSAGPLAALARAGAGATVDVVLTGDPILLVPRAGGYLRGTPAWLIDGRAERVRSGPRAFSLRQPVLVLASGQAWRGLLPSTRIRLAAVLDAPRPGDTVAAVVRVRGSPQVLRRPSELQRDAGRLRSGLRAASAGLPAAEAGLLPGLVDGDTSRLPPALAADFRATGLTHLVAVSGSNVAAVLAAALLLARLLPSRLRFGGRGDAVVASLLLIGFVVLARPSPSVLRAAVMGLLAMAALLTGRTRPALPALSAAVLLLILADPALALSPGFALSTLASGALLVLAPGWRQSLMRRGLRARIAEAIAVPLAAQVVCGPVIAVFTGSVSCVAVAANLLAAPAVPFATVAGVSAAVCAPVSQTLARLAAEVAAIPCWWLVEVARSGAALPAASLPWPSGSAGGLLLLVVTAVLLGAVRRTARRFLPVRPVGA